MKKLRIKENHRGYGIPAMDYIVVDENGTTQFIGSYTECYYFMFPNVDDDYSDKESFDKAWE